MRIAKLTGKRVAQGLIGLALAAGVAFVPAQQASAAEPAGGPGQLTIALEPQADTASRNDGVDTYKVIVGNRGGGMVEPVDVTLPFNAGYTPAAASFTQDDAWVARISDGSLNVRVEQMRGKGDTMVGTLRFAGPRDAAQNAVTGHATLAWSFDGKAYSITSNAPSAGTTVLSAAAAGNSLTFNGGNFAAGEPVTFWYTSAAGVSTPLVLDGARLLVAPAKDDDDDDDDEFAGSMLASAQGTVSVTFDARGLPAGAYTLAARGNWSGAVAATAFQVR